MGLLKDFWNYLKYKEKIADAYRAKKNPLAELDLYGGYSGPLVALFILTLFIIFVDIVLWMYEIWLGMIIITLVYILIVLVVLYDFNKNFRKLENRKLYKTKIAKELREMKDESKLKRYQPYLIIFLGFLLIAFEIYIWHNRIIFKIGKTLFTDYFTREVMMYIFIGLILIAYGFYLLRKYKKLNIKRKTINKIH